jgi:hypothetical protein
MLERRVRVPLSGSIARPLLMLECPFKTTSQKTEEDKILFIWQCPTNKMVSQAGCSHGKVNLDHFFPFTVPTNNRYLASMTCLRKKQNIAFAAL